MPSEMGTIPTLDIVECPAFTRTQFIYTYLLIHPPSIPPSAQPSVRASTSQTGTSDVTTGRHASHLTWPPGLFRGLLLRGSTTDSWDEGFSRYM